MGGLLGPYDERPAERGQKPAAGARKNVWTAPAGSVMDADREQVDAGGVPELVIGTGAGLQLPAVVDLIGPAPVLAGDGEEPRLHLPDESADAGVELEGSILPGVSGVHPGYT